MYFETTIAKLSRPQLVKLLNGEKIRIKKGAAHKIHLTEPQLKGLEQKHKLGKAHTINFTKDQATKQGAGLMGDIYNFVKRNPYIKNAVNSAIRGGKKHLHHGVNYLSTKAHQKIAGIPMIGEGVRKRRRPRGRGLGGMALTGGAELANLIGGPGSSEASKVLGTLGGVANFLGLGMKKGHKYTQAQKEAMAIKRAATRGKKLLGVLGTSGSSKLLSKPKKKATPAQLAALARGRATRDANRRARRGGSLYAAGY